MRVYAFWAVFVLLFSHQSLLAQSVYWQQTINTRIEVTLDDVRHRLHGFISINYINHSPDTLKQIYLHLYPNAYKHDQTAFAEQQIDNKQAQFYYSEPKDRGYMDSLTFTINEKPVQHYSEENQPDIAVIDLPSPLLPGDSLTLATPFRVKIPKIFSRLGHNGQAYFISQWFPKPAVYDHQGWHPMPYLDQGEFYSEYGHYDVLIHLPKDYVVMATGNLENEEEQQWLDQLSALTVEETKNRIQNLDPHSTIKSIHFTENEVHDFAWFANKQYMVRKKTVPHFGDSVVLYSAFMPQDFDNWEKALYYLQHTLDSMGAWVGPYPYKTMKAVSGDMLSGGAMEYPTITIVDQSGQEYLSKMIVHEAGHNWFYGILGSNERRYPWMDEGVNSFYEKKLLTTLKTPPNHKKDINEIAAEIGAKVQQTFGRDQSLMLPAVDYTSLNYAVGVYSKSAQYFSYLEDYLGAGTWQRCMQHYYHQWAKKHPYPSDFKACFEQISGKNLSWFFEGMMQNNRKINTRIIDVQPLENQYKVIAQNKNDFALPLVVQAWANEKLITTQASDPVQGLAEINFTISNTPPTHFILTAPAFNKRLQVFALQKGIKKKSLLHVGFKKWNHPAASINLLPALGINNYDGLMAGAVLHNMGLPSSAFQYVLVPMYSLKAKTWAGLAGVGYTLLPRHSFQQIITQVDFKSFHKEVAYFNAPQPLFARYIKIAPGITFIQKEKNPVSHIRRGFQLKYYHILEEDFRYQLDVTDSLFKPKTVSENNMYGNARYFMHNSRMVNPYSYQAEVQAGETFMKFNLEGKVKISYHTPKKGFYVRGYFGKFLSLDNSYTGNRRYWLNTSFTAANDYLYEGTYFGRSEREGILSRQFAEKEGAESLPTHLYASPLGRSDNWLAALNLKTDLPLKNLPLRLYLNAGTFAQASALNPSNSKLLYSAGLQFYLLDDWITMQIPLLVSKEYREYYQSVYGKNRIWKSISFSVQLDNFNVFRLPKNMVDFIVK